VIVDNHATSPRCLSDSKPGDLLQVRLIVFELVRSRCWDLTLQEGDLLRYVEDVEGGIRISRLDGTRVTVPLECARFIGVRLVPQETRDIRRRERRRRPRAPGEATGGESRGRTISLQPSRE
jgi:hypothetical protein